ncbi:transmembrane protein [Perilla frutescens var. hirtella]|nr:transmembrane protein [Perilla frutescens var. hirtella]
MYGAPMLSSLHVSVSTPRLIADHKNIKPAINVVAESNSRARARARTRAVNDGIISAIASSDPAQAQVTWQIVAGALAGVAPFVVAGIEFSKRIVRGAEEL